MTHSKQNAYFENVHDLIGRPGEMRERDLVIAAPEQFGEALARVPAGEEVELNLKLESVHDGILVSALVHTTMHAECGRCLTEFTAPLEVAFQELFAYTPTEADEYGVHGDHVNLEPPLRDAVVLALPFQPVCRPDCPGLDPETGELRDAEADAGQRETDPRWAALAELLADEDETDVSRETGSTSK